MAGNPFDAITVPSGGGAPAPSGGGSSNPFDAISLGGGPAASGNSGNAELQSVEAANQKLVNDISLSGNGGAIAAANGAATHGGGNWFSDVLHAIDLPRAAVVSGVEQAGLGLRDLLGNGGPGASLQGFEQGVNDHVTVGHILHTDDGVNNKWVDSLGGIAGDVALDPLTYVGGLAEAAKGIGVASRVAEGVNAASEASRAADAAAQTAQAVAEAQRVGKGLPEALAAHSGALSALKTASDTAAEKTVNGALTADTLTRLQTKGVSGLNDVERQALTKLTGTKIDSGLGFRVPGSKLLGNEKMIKLLPSAATDPLSSALKGLSSRVADTKVVGGLEKALVTHGAIKGAMRAAALEGDGEKVAALNEVLRQAGTAGAKARSITKTYGNQFASALDQIPQEAMRHVPGALEGSPDAIDAIRAAGGHEGLGALQKTYGAIKDEAAAHGVQMGNIEHYFPHQLTQEARDIFERGGSSKRSGTAFNHALRRELKPGAHYLGHEISDPRVSGESVVDQVNRVTREVYGDGATPYDLFKTDPREVTANYLRGIARTIGQHHFLNKLDDMGVTHSGDVAMAPEDWVKLGETGANAGRQAPQFVKDALQKLAEEQSAGVRSGKFLQTYDRWLNIWKQYSLAMPGKAIRHMFAGPAWGTYLANVGSRSLREGFSEWRTFQRAVAAHGGDVEEALKTLDPKIAKEIGGALEHGIFHGHEFDMRKINNTEKVIGSRTLGKANKFNPLSTHHGYFKANVEVQRRGQDYWRFAMYHDAVKKGALAPEAAQKVRMMLGDPHNITNVERSTMRRVVPFYTFLRQNLPVELRNLATQPGKFVNAYEAPKEETEQWTPSQGIVPQMFDQTLGVRLPWQVGGNQVYLSPDLPFTRIGQLFGGRNQLEAQTSPVIQDLLAYFNNTQAFTGNQFSATAKPVPGTWQKIPGLMELMHAVDPNGVMQTQRASSDYGQTTPAGEWVMTPRDASMWESLFPPLSQMRRAIPTEANYKTRGDTSLLADLVGQNFRTLDPAQQSGELLRRQAILKQMVEHEQNEGEIPHYLYGFHQ